MLNPSKKVLLWASEEQARRSKEKNLVPFANLSFKFTHDGEDFLVKTQRNFDQKLISEAFPKLTNLMKKRLQTKQIKFDDKESKVLPSPQSAEFITESTTVEDLLGDLRIETVMVNGEEFQVIRDAMPIQSVILGITPLVGFYCMPTVSFNTKPAPITQNHWFVKNIPEETESRKHPTKKESDALQTAYVDEKNREFSVEGYTFKTSAPFFVPDIADVNKKIVVLVETGEDHPVFASISSREVTKSPEEIVTDEQVRWCRKNRADRGKSDVLRVMTYNILADLYLNLNLEQQDLFFNYCPKPNQRVFYRTPILLKQLSDFAKAGVDLFFLQEVDVSRHENHISPFLRTVNYQSELAKKWGTVSEGVAIVFDTSRFKLVKSEAFPIFQLAQEVSENEDVRKMLETSEETKERFTTRPTIIQIVVLEERNSGVLLLCGNTHLHHNPQEEHLKVLQTLLCVRKILSVHKEISADETISGKEGEKKKIRIMFGGDYNSTPDGAVFEMLSTGRLPKTDEVWKLDAKFEAQDLTIEKAFTCLSGTPEYTNYTADSRKNGFVGCLDYVWGIEMSMIRRCPMPEHSKIIEFTGLPSPTSPSDHLPVITDIKLE